VLTDSHVGGQGGFGGQISGSSHPARAQPVPSETATRHPAATALTDLLTMIRLLSPQRRFGGSTRPAEPGHELQERAPLPMSGRSTAIAWPGSSQEPITVNHPS